MSDPLAGQPINVDDYAATLDAHGSQIETANVEIASLRTSFTYIEDRVPRGLVGFERLDDEVLSSGTPVIIGQASFTVEADRWYEVAYSGTVSSTVAGDLVGIEITHEVGGDPEAQVLATIPIASAAVPASCRMYVGTPDVSADVGQTHTYAVYAVRVAGSGNAGHIANLATGVYGWLTVKDVGYRAPD
jgi:hypothetical protein